ncbi:MAG TPA: hypothetical protein VH396_18995, partial [Chitinophagaceae bacterium]
MKCLLIFIAMLPAYLTLAQQPLIHSHNDYAQLQPFVNAWRNKAFSIEADVYPGDSLPVAHDKRNITPGKTLVGMYQQPIIMLFEKYHGHISDDTAYAPVLMIDIKENSEAVITQLVKLLAPYRDVFDRTVNPKSVQVVLSGERGSVQHWVQWPSYILFDGRPDEIYDSATLQRVAFISDSYMNYANNKDSIERRLQRLVK